MGIRLVDQSPNARIDGLAIKLSQQKTDFDADDRSGNQLAVKLNGRNGGCQAAASCEQADTVPHGHCADLCDTAKDNSPSKDRKDVC